MVGVAVTRHPDRDSPRVDGMGGTGPEMGLLPVIAQVMCLTLWALLRAGVEGGVGDGSSSRALTLVTPWHLLRPSSSFPEAQEVALCQKDVPRLSGASSSPQPSSSRVTMTTPSPRGQKTLSTNV